MGPSRLCTGNSPVFNLHYSAGSYYIIRSHGLSYHLSADDTQLYIELCRDNNSSQTADIGRVERCVADIGESMRHNMLMLNDDKTEIILFHPKSTDSVEFSQGVTVGNSSISPSKSPRGILVWFFIPPCHSASRLQPFHELLTITVAIGWICHWSYSKIPWSSEHQAACSSCSCTCYTASRSQQHLYGLPYTLLKQLQRVQNACARMVMKCSKRDHITPILRELHWLPVHSPTE